MKIVKLPQELIDYIFERSNFETCLKSQLCSIITLKSVFLKEKWTKKKSIYKRKFNIYKYIIDNNIDIVEKKDILQSVNYFILFKYIYNNLNSDVSFDRIDYIDYITRCKNNETFKTLINDGISNFILTEDDLMEIKKINKSAVQSKYLDIFTKFL